MSGLDWLVLGVTLAGMILYGIYKGRGSRNLDGYFLAHQSMPWYVILLSVMATQASAVTFLGGPGQGFTDGMRFVQYYFGLPLAMIVLSVTFVPIYHRLKVFTAYEFLEQRFDLKTRALTSFLFLLQRGLSTGISIYAPAIILSSLLGWNIFWTNLAMGGLLILYAVTGGTKAIAYTQMQQLFIITAGMFLAGYMVVHLLPSGVSFSDALHVSGKLGKLDVIVTDFHWKDKYNIYSGVIGGFFLALSYFGTDQSQVGRYLGARSIAQSRLGLLLNGLVKVPMQFVILLLGALLLVFYQFYQAPVLYNKAQLQQVSQSPYGAQLKGLEHRYQTLSLRKQQTVEDLLRAMHAHEASLESRYTDSLRYQYQVSERMRSQARSLVHNAAPKADTNDTNYIFLYFVLNRLPRGLVGLLIAVIFLAAWGSTAAALNSLASASVVDFYQRIVRKEASAAHYLKVSRWCTLGWGVFCIGVADYADRIGGSLIEVVNVLGSLFYGTILGIFLVAFYVKRLKGGPTFWAALAAEGVVLALYRADWVSFLWLNAIGCLLVLALAPLFQWLGSGKRDVPFLES